MQGLYEYEIENWCLERKIEGVDDWRRPGNPVLLYSDAFNTADPITNDVLAEAASASCL